MAGVGQRRGPPGPARRPSRPGAGRAPGRRNTSVTVKWVASAPPARSSTIATSVTRGPAGVRAQCTTTSMLSLTSVFSAASGSPPRRVGQLAHEPQPGQRLAGRPGVDGRVPVTPDDRVSSRGSASRSRTSPTIATSGAMRRNPATSRRRSMAGRSARAGAGLHLGDVRDGDVRLEHLLRHHDPQRRVELGGRARQQRRLARPRRPREHDRQPGPHARPQERGDLGA